MNPSPYRLNEFGSRDAARGVLERWYGSSPAYRKLIDDTLAAKGKSELHEMIWEEVPIITKKGFFAGQRWRDVMPKESYWDTYSIIRSSGTTSTDGANRGFFWPQLKSVDARMTPAMQSIIVKTFELAERKTLVVIGLSLGSWAGGEQMAFVFKALALQTALPLVVFSPGNEHGEILEIIEKCGDEFEQILIALCPSAIFYLSRLADNKGLKLPFEKISFLMTGEPFPEELRADLQRRGRERGAVEPLAGLSVYGAADTGMIGVESSPLVRVRGYLADHPDVASQLGFKSRSVPNLYHLQPGETLFEVVNDELLVSKWQGVPLVRYNLEDRVQMFDWSGFCEKIASLDPAVAPTLRAMAREALPPIIAVSGRSKGCVFLCGSNIFESMLHEVFLKSSLKAKSTGTFLAWTEARGGQQLLALQIELRPGQAAPTGNELDRLHTEWVELLREQQPEFGLDYDKFYRAAEAEGLRLFKFHFCETPHLTQHPRLMAGTKHKIIVDNGPY